MPVINFLTDYLGETAGPLVGVLALVAATALVIWLVMRLLGRGGSGLFVSGGAKGRQPRLAVTDAVPVDSHRRLVLVRRDDVEHLIMIGGPADVVIESGIAKNSAANTALNPVSNTSPRPAETIQREQPPRPAAEAARDAVAEAERGRPVRTAVQSPQGPATLVPAAPPVAMAAPAAQTPAVQTPAVQTAPLASAVAAPIGAAQSAERASSALPAVLPVAPSAPQPQAFQPAAAPASVAPQTQMDVYPRSAAAPSPGPASDSAAPAPVVQPVGPAPVPQPASEGRVEPTFATQQSFTGHSAASRASAELDRILSEMDLGRPQR
ncbi:MAG: flagellar biosynthetic protein FliO [Rhizobiaceae bacterium]|nr:flagellar biosynthetic protein FliO [Rhizobiaceae bacterium]